ncbi:hypothetical protein AAC387_Pa11g0629 [Persea americana]
MMHSSGFGYVVSTEGVDSFSSEEQSLLPPPVAGREGSSLVLTIVRGSGLFRLHRRRKEGLDFRFRDRRDYYGRPIISRVRCFASRRLLPPPSLGRKEEGGGYFGPVKNL